MLAGMLPVKKHVCMPRYRSCLQLESAGKKSSVPVRRLLLMSRYLSSLRFPTVAGTYPVKLFDSSASSESWDRLPREAGNDPVS